MDGRFTIGKPMGKPMRKPWENFGVMGFYGIEPLVMSVRVCDIEHGPVEIVDFPINLGGSFQFVIWLFTRG